MDDRLSQKLKEMLLQDEWRIEKLKEVRALGLEDCWIGAGFVRNKVWDYLHGFSVSSPLNDVDVIYFEPNDFSRERDLSLEERLAQADSTINWSVKNQARMHAKHGYAPYQNCEEAISHWVETPTCVAARLTDIGEIELIAPHGLKDLMNLIVNPTIGFAEYPHKEIYLKRINEKQWGKRWPNLRILL